MRSLLRLACIIVLCVPVVVFGTGKPVQESAFGETSTPVHVQVVAHPDDDMIFMNPDLAADIRAHMPVTSIYLTAGESDVADVAHYAASRQAGTRAAFAEMAGTADSWTRREIEASPGHYATLFMLTSRPAIRLIFLNLPDDNDPAAIGGKNALTRLWENPRALVRTVVPAGTAAVRSSDYDRESVIDVVARTLMSLAPREIRLQDPRPDMRYQQQWGRFHDHPDHVMSALFAQAAVERTAAETRLVHYRDYDIGDTPRNLPADVVRDKRNTFAAYAAHDPLVGMAEPYAGWLARMRYRSGQAGSVARDHLGRATVASRSGGAVTVDAFTGMRRDRVVLPGICLDSVEGAPVLTARPDGGLSLFARTCMGSIALASQDVSGNWRSGWEVLTPRAASASAGNEGHPAGVASGNGIVLAERNSRGGVSVAGAGMGWTDIGGSEVGEDVSITGGIGGEVHIFAGSRHGLLHWRRARTGTPFVLTVEKSLRPASFVTATKSPTGVVFGAYREAGTARVVVFRTSGGRTQIVGAADAGLGTQPSIAVELSARGEIPRVAVRDAGGIVVLRFSSRMSAPQRWVLPGHVPHEPILVPGGHSLIVEDDHGMPILKETD